VTSLEQADYFRIRVLLGVLKGDRTPEIDAMFEELSYCIEDGNWSYDPEACVIDTGESLILITTQGEFVDLPAISSDQSVHAQ
jgi:hypothetical protein